jgi:acyl carrier protein
VVAGNRRKRIAESIIYFKSVKMEHQKIISDINQIFRDILDNPEIQLNDHTTAKDVEDWDSLNHIQIVVAIEKHFGIKFTAQEIQQWQNVGDICNSVAKRLG